MDHLYDTVGSLLVKEHRLMAQYDGQIHTLSSDLFSGGDL